MLRFDRVADELKKAYENFKQEEKEKYMNCLKQELENDHEFCELANFIINSLTQQAIAGNNSVIFYNYNQTIINKNRVDYYWHNNCDFTGTSKNGLKCTKNLLNEFKRYKGKIENYLTSIGINVHVEPDPKPYNSYNPVYIKFSFDV
jgi:hypothetical protein